MSTNLDGIYAQAEKDVAPIDSHDKLAALKADYLGASSALKQAFLEIKTLPSDQKGAFGKKVNEVKVQLEALFIQKDKEITEKEARKKIEEEKDDISLPGRNHFKGAKHPCRLIEDDLTQFFLGLGYSVAEGNDVESDLFNFELVNIPKDHPARDMQDSFYIDDNLLLRSQTSGVQAHVMQERKGIGPIKIICPGKTYRRDDDDLTHSHQFSQCEGLVVSEDASMGMLMETLTLMMRHFFGEKREVRFRPSFFPFTEPSIEVDVSCFNCSGKGCPMCKNTGWIEVLGAGMVHPNVLRLNGFDPEKYQGFAFGVGLERIAMLKYGIDDIRKLFLSDTSFLKQFRKE
ncbi:MAG: phenylalanine--tRNA ligase subunit alpha [Bacilli bacterium]|jgi:phenylalanyl-tRNA synthetase alpha chain|nr:phenylalanine--tRNA ligase subunit alpha [Bacilli bacterium]